MKSPEKVSSSRSSTVPKAHLESEKQSDNVETKNSYFHPSTSLNSEELLPSRLSDVYSNYKMSLLNSSNYRNKRDVKLVTKYVEIALVVDKAMVSHTQKKNLNPIHRPSLCL